ncbi:MAG TPA: hypothetical protein DCQ50_20480 [Chryseobacterium sp.]|nr:hypothetical protein [Chryseobacterium sp.]
MANNIKNRDISMAWQVSAMRSKYPAFTTSFTSHSSIKISGTLQPTSRSATYSFVLKYNMIESPKIRIITPVLQKNGKGEDIPHIYPGDNLCLYHPRYNEFNRTDFLCDTIIPWTSLWLYYYEVWHLTDEWLGGGEHPGNQNPITNEATR